MTGRLFVMALVLATTVAGNGGAQNRRSQVVRWNDRGESRDTADAPTVRVWLEGVRSYSYGAPVRVWFSVSEDAYVVVARVDANGHLTLLSPASRTSGTGVSGGRDVLVRGRRGAASFYATDRMGGGFVFAIASYDPFDLSRLGIRDFDRYVTGTYIGRPSTVYIGDPHRIVSRFASMVSYSDVSPFDYAVDFYNVDAPYYVTSAGYSNFCNGYSGYDGVYRRSLSERWDDEFYYGSGVGASYNCRSATQCGNLSWNGFGTGYGYDYGTYGFINPLCFLGRQPRSNPGTGPLPPQNGDSLKVPGWLGDSIRAGHPDTVGVIPDRRTNELRDGLNSLRRGTTGTEGPRGPVIIADDDPTGRSYAIPGRALRNSPITLGERRDRDAATAGRPDRISPANDGGAGIDWVRPPREAVEGPRNYGEGALPRSPRDRGDRGVRSNDDGIGRPTFVNPSSGRTPVRAEPNRNEPTRYEPPTRTYGPRFDAPPPNVRTSADAPRYEPPPRNDSPRSYTPSPATQGGDHRPAPRAEPVRADPPRASGPPASPATTGEKKPEKPEKP